MKSLVIFYMVSEREKFGPVVLCRIWVILWWSLIDSHLSSVPCGFSVITSFFLRLSRVDSHLFIPCCVLDSIEILTLSSHGRQGEICYSSLWNNHNFHSRTPYSSSITSTKLSESKNYLSWSACIRTFLTSKEKLRYIEEEKPEVASPKWVKEDAQVRSWLRNSVESHVSSDVMLLPTAYAVWESIKETYGLEGNIQRVYELCEDNFLTKQRIRPLHEQ